MASKTKQSKIGDYFKIKKLWQKKKFRRVVLCSGLIVFVLAASFFIYNLSYQNRIFPHTYIGGVDFGGLTKDQAKERLSTLISQNADGKLSYQHKDKTYEISFTNLGLTYLQDKSVENLLAIGRNGSLRKIFVELYRSIISRNQTVASFDLEKASLDEYLSSISGDINHPEKDASIEIRDQKPQVTKAEIGQKFDLFINREIAKTAIGEFKVSNEIPFVISQIKPKIDEETAQAAISATNDLLNRKITLKTDKKDFEITPNDMAGLLEFVARPERKINLTVKYKLSPEISETKLAPTLNNIASQIDQEPKDAKFQVSSGKVTAFQLSQTGYQLDKAKASDQIIKALMKGDQTVTLPIKITEPEISSTDPSESGIVEQIGEGTTSWRGSPQNRIHNLSLGAEKISGTLVKPGQEFSTLKTIGEIGPSTGFLPELVIKNVTQVEPDYGGGLCQVSTTLFRAILNSGLKITARTPHSFRVSYYEPPVGMDATIFDPAPDFRFVNNMSTPILIWGYASNNSLTFQVFGTKDKRKIDISEPWVGDYVSPPGPVYTESASMAPGEIRQVERATPGASASFTYKVTAADGGILSNETFTSKYAALPDSFLVGPGTNVLGEQAPPAEPAPTPAPTPTPKPTTTKKR